MIVYTDSGSNRTESEAGFPIYGTIGTDTVKLSHIQYSVSHLGFLTYLVKSDVCFRMVLFTQAKTQMKLAYTIKGTG